MIDDRFLDLVEDSNQLPQVDCLHLDEKDRLIVETDLHLFQLELITLSLIEEPPVWLARASANGDFFLAPTALMLVGAHQEALKKGEVLDRSRVFPSRLIGGFRMVLAELRESACFVVGPVRHVWHNGQPQF